MLFDTPIFVVQRRVNQPLADVQRGLADRAGLLATGMLDLGPDGLLCMPEPLHPVRLSSSGQPFPTWCGTARLLTPRNRLVATVELEVSMWSDDATSVTLRPDANHPERWRAWRLRRYFALALRGRRDRGARRASSARGARGIPKPPRARRLPAPAGPCDR